VIDRGRLITHAAVPDLVRDATTGSAKSLEDVFFELTSKTEGA
jgi:hypothetical protein